MSDRHSVVISGTHGKTTTTSLASYLLHAAGRDPSLLVGGISLDFGGSFREGAGPHFVVEGDEYDTAFFDKTPKFLHYHPQTLVVTSVEFDHADIYRDLDHVKSAFREVVGQMPPDGTIIADLDHANVRDVISGARCPVVGYSVEGAGDGRAADAGVDVTYARASLADELGTSFALHAAGRAAVDVRIPLHGAFNVANATAALVAVEVLGVPLRESAPLLPRFQGVKRRQEFLGEVNGVAVIDDFAHHPTAVKGSIEALRERYPERRLIAVFEPRTNTSRRRIFQQAYVDALAGADRVLVQRVPDTPIYSATGEVTERFSADELGEALRERGVPTTVSSEVEEIVSTLAADQRPGDVVLVMSNGAFGGIWEKLLERLKG
jgi:UDP-N-acetylmuramate: L-alanyl-gamma-D-glutamyl-meso-diaminopimelate ligase